MSRTRPSDPTAQAGDARAIDQEPCPWVDDAAIAEPLRVDHYITGRISHVSKALNRSASRLYQDHFGLTLPESRALSVIAARGSCAARDIADEVSLDKALISRAIKQLTLKELISAGAGVEDQRVMMLKLTAKGRRIHEQIVPVARARQDALMETLTEEERRVLWRVLGKLEARVERFAEGEGEGAGKAGAGDQAAAAGAE